MSKRKPRRLLLSIYRAGPDLEHFDQHKDKAEVIWVRAPEVRRIGTTDLDLAKWGSGSILDLPDHPPVWVDLEPAEAVDGIKNTDTVLPYGLAPDPRVMMRARAAGLSDKQATVLNAGVQLAKIFGLLPDKR